ncbi:uncharacterized protein LOC135816787 [Sycon ciliatum]|uniref:uncharacterized protein LOC135816787 n=1 Tax=Sycon ciliatum TaxID=27933 RepID=UPI0031F6703A
MASYLREHCRGSLSFAERRRVRKLCPRPDVEETRCPRVDPFLADVQGLANAKRADRMLANIQQKVTDVFRPLAALWAAIEQGRPVHELTELVQMAIVMTGDASNVLSETRRQRLMAALPKRCPKSLLQGLRPSGDLLFGDGFSREYKRKCQEMDEIEDLLSKGAIRPVSPSPGQFVSRLFTVPKKGTTAERPVIDLRHLNEHVRYEHFQMEGLHLVPLSVREGNWLTKLDLKDAYFTVPIHPQHRRLLRFSWEGQLYEFQCLPFGLSSAPRVFTKLMKVPISVLRRQGIRLILYLDDLLLIAESRPAAVLQTQQAIQLLESLGFVINRKKSIPEPTQQLEFLGFQLNSVAMTMSVPIDKARKLQQECHRALSQPYLSIRALASLLGRMVACSPGMFLAPLQFRHLQQLKIAALRRHQSYLATVRLTPEARTELTWWAADLETWNGRSILKPPAQLTIFSDASLLGWGAVCGTTSTGGQWSPTEANLHINALELIAASFAVKAFHHRASYRPLHIKLLIDNTTAVSYINRLGGTHSRLLSQIACDLWRWAVQHDIRLQAEYVPSEENPADHPSRGSLSESGDWRLDPALFRRIQRAAPWTLGASSCGLTPYLPDDTGRTSMGYAAMVRDFAAAVGRFPHASAHIRLPATLTLGPSTPTGTIPPPAPRRMAYLQQRFNAAGLSPQVVRLLSSSWRSSTNAAYASAWEQWLGWCSQRSVDPVCPSLAMVLQFLADSFEDGRSYSTLNVYRSAMSATLPELDGAPIGQHPLVVRLLRGICLERPPQPRYSHTWDVGIVTSWLSKLPANTDLSLPVLSGKLAILMALTAARRSSDLHRLSLNSHRFSAEGVVFDYLTPPKQHRPGSEPARPVTFAAFPVTPALCVVECFREYLRRTADLRQASSAHLFLSTKRPHHPVTSATIARWIKQVMSKAGVDTSLFGAHSTRAASTSAAKRKGMSTVDIMKCADWSCASVFQRFYFKPWEGETSGSSPSAHQQFCRSVLAP